MSTRAAELSTYVRARCSRYSTTEGQCHTRRCLVRGGADLAARPVDHKKASCEEHELEQILNAVCALLLEYDEERQAINVEPDAGCIECTVGTVPNDRNTGLCAFHVLTGFFKDKIERRG